MRAWLRRLGDKIKALAYEVLDKVLTTFDEVPGLPYVFRRQIINSYLKMTVEARFSPDDAGFVAAVLSVKITPFTTLAELRAALMPLLRPRGGTT